MGSRSLRSPKPDEPLSGWPRTLLAKVKQQRRPFMGNFEVGRVGFLPKFAGEREAHFASAANTEGPRERARHHRGLVLALSGSQGLRLGAFDSA